MTTAIVNGAIHGRVRTGSGDRYQVLQLTGQQRFPDSNRAYGRFQRVLAVIDADRSERGRPPADEAERTAMWTLYRLGAFEQWKGDEAIVGAEARAAIDAAPVASEVA